MFYFILCDLVCTYAVNKRPGMKQANQKNAMLPTWCSTVPLFEKMLNVTKTTVSKMTGHCAATAQMREKSESGRIRKWEEMWFKMRAEDGEIEGTAVTCDGRLFHRRAAAPLCLPQWETWRARWWSITARLYLSQMKASQMLTLTVTVYVLSTAKQS